MNLRFMLSFIMLIRIYVGKLYNRTAPLFSYFDNRIYLYVRPMTPLSPADLASIRSDRTGNSDRRCIQLPPLRVASVFRER